MFKVAISDIRELPADSMKDLSADELRALKGGITTNIIKGSTITIGPDGIPVIQQFGGGIANVTTGPNGALSIFQSVSG